MTKPVISQTSHASHALRCLSRFHIRSSWKMSGTRVNTLVVDFSVLPVRPEVAKVHQFLEEELKIQYEDVKSIQLHHARNCVLIEMKTKEIVTRYQLEHNWKRTMLSNNVKFRIPVYVDCEAVTVRVHDLPPSISHVTIAEHMLKYGEVISIRKEKWKHYFPGISNGVRVLRMNILRHIPSFITIENEDTMVTYNGQPKSDQSSRPGKCPEPTTTSNGRPPSSTATKSPNGLFTQDDFPPIANSLQKTTTPVPESVQAKQNDNSENNNDDDWTDDESASNSSSEYNGATYKRRRSRQNNKGCRTKKACSSQCSPNTDHAEMCSSPDEKGKKK